MGTLSTGVGDLTYKQTSTAAAIVFLIVSLSLILVPDLIYWMFGLVGNPLGDFLALRAAMLFLGLAALCYFGRTAPPSELRSVVAASLCISLAALALAGVYEFMRGYAGPGIWLAIVIEVALCGAFARFAIGR